MTTAERARLWFQHHAQRRLAPDGSVTSYGVEWSEEVEASLVNLLDTALAEATLPKHEAWQDKTNWTPPRYGKAAD